MTRKIPIMVVEKHGAVPTNDDHSEWETKSSFCFDDSKVIVMVRMRPVMRRRRVTHT
jgi:hypothetical protein